MLSRTGPHLQMTWRSEAFLGFMGYYHRFIPKFAQVAWLLYELTSGENMGKKKVAITVRQHVSIGL